MARSHHRKKHKEHVRQFRQTQDSTGIAAKQRTKATTLFSIVGGLTGGAVSYFATQGDVIWVIVGLIAGAAIGYFIGKKIEDPE